MNTVLIAWWGIVVLALLVGAKRKVPIISCYYLFIAFSLLYCAYMFFGSDVETGGLSLLENYEIINYVVSSTLLGLLFFIFFYWYGTDSKKFVKKQGFVYSKKEYVRKDIFLPTYIALLTILIIFAKNFGWHAVSRDGVVGIETSLFAYGKYFFVCMGLMGLWVEPLSKKWAIFILLTQTFLMLFDGGRATFFGLVVAYAWILSVNGVNLKASQMGYLFLFALILLASRALVLGEGLIDGMVSSVVAEGIFAGYTGLQMGDYVLAGGGYLYGFSYLLDPIIYLLPQGIRENYLLFITLSVNNYIGKENFGPMGGFFWIAEAIANFGFFGGAVIGSVYGYFLSKLENYQTGKGYYKIFIVAAFGSLLSKYYVANGVKIAIFYLIAALIIKKVFVRHRASCGMASLAT
ncbi:MAG: hypothetical protein B7X60_00560 [Polynucleobacter sp. 39-45-136]|jgi:hypothetical protein|nr:MAG: hypothetical protein B7X60_00560 [Polynucleobacter sp. 39-45-136]